MFPIVVISKIIITAVTGLVTTQPRISTLERIRTNKAVLTFPIPLLRDLAVPWTWRWAASLLLVPVVIRRYFLPRAVAQFAFPLQLLISTPPALTGIAENQQEQQFQLHLGAGG